MQAITTTIGPGAAGNSTAMVRLDEWAPPLTSIQVNVAGTVNYTIQTSLDDPNSATSPVPVANMTWFNTGLVGNTSSLQTTLTAPAIFVRTLLVSGNGTVATTVLQSGVVPY